ncbi:Rtkn2 [Anthophora retusa]
MAPRRRSIGGLRGSSSTVLDKENNYLRSLSDYQARVRRRESIRNCKNVAEYDLKRKIDLEIKIKEGSSKLLAAARHPAQSLEAARALFTSTKRMSAYMVELQQRKGDVSLKASITENKGKLSISDLRFPLMWRDSDHFKNRGDYRRFAVFCIIRVGAQVHDTSLVYPVDREQTDICFSDILLFDNVPAEFELSLEIYSHVLQEDLSIASTPRRIRRSIHSSISKTVAIQPHYVDKEVCAEYVIVNNQRCWVRLRGFEIEAWKSKKSLNKFEKPTYTIYVNKETIVRRSKSKANQLHVINRVDGNETSDIIQLYSTENAEKWFEQLATCVKEHARWKHAVINLQGSLYDETPLIESTFPKLVSKVRMQKESF